MDFGFDLLVPVINVFLEICNFSFVAFGVTFTLKSVFIYFWFHDGFISVRLILGIIFVFITAPVAGHLVCRAAYRSRVPLAEGSGDDALKPVLFGEELAENESSGQLANSDVELVDEAQGK